MNIKKLIGFIVFLLFVFLLRSAFAYQNSYCTTPGTAASCWSPCGIGTIERLFELSGDEWVVCQAPIYNFAYPETYEHVYNPGDIIPCCCTNPEICGACGAGVDCRPCTGNGIPETYIVSGKSLQLACSSTQYSIQGGCYRGYYYGSQLNPPSGHWVCSDQCDTVCDCPLKKGGPNCSCLSATWDDVCPPDMCDEVNAQLIEDGNTVLYEIVKINDEEMCEGCTCKRMNDKSEYYGQKTGLGTKQVGHKEGGYWGYEKTDPN